MTGAIETKLIGRFGNQLFQYAHARALAEREGVPLITPPWIGEHIFEIPNPPREHGDATEISGYCQRQQDLIYTRKQVRQWLRFRPEIETKLAGGVPAASLVAHRRIGDYPDCGYVVVSEKSYHDCVNKFNLSPAGIRWVGEESEKEVRVAGISHSAAFLPHFYMMMKAESLLRANSTFSWWAGTLGEPRIFSPIIEGKPGGIQEQDCEFVEGNWPRFVELPFVENLFLKP